MKSLEISCHGIPWLMLAIAGIYVTSLKEAAVNLLIGLVLDIVIVAVLKAFTRRRRPAYDVDDQVRAFAFLFSNRKFLCTPTKKTKNAFAQGDDSEDGGQV